MLLDFFPSRTLTWYLGKTFVVRILAVLVMLVLVLMMLDLLSKSGDILAIRGNGEAELLRYVSLRIPQLVARFLPYSVLLATIIPEAPAILRYGLLMPIEFISNIIVRPITLTVRLTANFVAGHFLLAIFFLGTVFFLENGPKTWAFAALSFPLSLMLVGLELFVAALQAFIFAVLSASYIGQAMAEGH